jgi:hypothetical protein
MLVLLNLNGNCNFFYTVRQKMAENPKKPNARDCSKTILVKGCGVL